jgi:hypothetical protein
MLERAIDGAVLGILIVVMIHTPSTFARLALLAAFVLILLGWIAAWWRPKVSGRAPPSHARPVFALRAATRQPLLASLR